MSAQNKLNQIPIREEHVPGAQSIHLWRRISQYGFIVVLVLIPLTGLFRIDPIAGSFRILSYQVWFSDIAIVMGFWLMVATLLIFLYSWAGSVFCAWACPQNTISEWANAMTARLLGRRALMMDVSGKRMKVARRKDVWLNKIVLALSFLCIAMLIAIIPLLYFFPPHVILSFLMLKPVPAADGLLWIYSISTLVVLIDIAVMRHLVCKFMCVYRVWQHSFKTSETLHIAYDEARAEDCEHCTYCVDSCFLDIDPRQTQVFDSCINCGECVTACDTLHEKSKKMQGPGLLSFSFGTAKEKNGLTTLLSRTRAATVGAVLGLMTFSIGILDYQPYLLVVDRAELMQGTTALDYRIHVGHKRYEPAKMHLRVDGLPSSSYTLEKELVVWDSVGRQDIMLHFSPHIAKGLHRVSIHAESDDGWKDTFTFQYFAE